MCYCVTVTKHFVIHWHAQGDCVYIIPLLLGLLYGCLNYLFHLFPGVANGDGISSKLNGNSIGSKIDTPNVKKRHRRAKSGGLKNVGDGDGRHLPLLLSLFSFVSISLLSVDL